MQITKQFVIAGNAKFTVSNPNGMKFAYQIKRTTREAEANQQGVLLVYTFSERGSRLYVGRLNEHTGLVTCGRRSKVSDGSLLHAVIRWACNVLWTNREFPAGYQAETVGRCGRCGRKLANPRQLFGPECQHETTARRPYSRAAARPQRAIDAIGGVCSHWNEHPTVAGVL